MRKLKRAEPASWGYAVHDVEGIDKGAYWIVIPSAEDIILRNSVCGAVSLCRP